MANSNTLLLGEFSSAVLESFRIKTFPIQDMFATDFSNANAKKGQTVTATLVGSATASTYHATNGFKGGGTPDEGHTLFYDVPITMNTFPVIPIKLSYLTGLSTNRPTAYQELVDNTAAAMGKAILDAALATVVAANFTYSSTVTIANTNNTTLSTARKALLGRGVQGNLVGVVNPDFMNALLDDTKIGSRDYNAKLIGANPYPTIEGVNGFTKIVEYASLPATGNLSAFFCNKNAIGIVARVPDNPQSLAESVGAAVTVQGNTLTDPDSGFSMLNVTWQEPATGDVYLSLAALYGVTGGAQGGSADDILDKAGHRIKTA